MVHDSNFLIQNIKRCNSSIKIVEPPEGVVGEGFFATTLNDVVGMARANSLWPLPLQPLVAVLSSWLPWPPIMI
jgi:hypothetical protein